MTDDSASNLEDIDAETRALLEASAAEHGLGVEDYMNEVLLRTLLREPQQAAPEQDMVAPAVAPAPLYEAQATRHRLDDMDRRLAIASSGFGSTIETIDRSLAMLAARTDDNEVRTEQYAMRLDAALADVRATVDAMVSASAGAGARLDALASAQAGLQSAQADLRTDVVAGLGELDERLRQTDDAAQSAHLALVNLRAGLVEELRILAAQAEQRISDHHIQFRTALEALAERSDRAVEDVARNAAAAVQRAGSEARAGREALEARVIEGFADAHARVDQMFTHASGLYDALAEKIGDSDRATASEIKFLADRTEARLGELRAQAHAALETMSERLTDTERASAAEIEHLSVRTGQRLAETQIQSQAALDALAAKLVAAQVQAADDAHGASQKLAAELGDLRERHLGAAARLRLLDDSLSKLAGDVGVLRDGIDARIAAAIEPVSATLAADRAQGLRELEALKADLARGAENTVRVRDALQAALHDVATRMNAEQGALRADIAALSAANAAGAEDTRAHAEAGFADLRAQQKGVLARLKLVDEAMETLARAQQAGEQRTVALSERFGRSETEHAALGSVLQDAVGRLSDRIDVVEANAANTTPASSPSRLDDIASRLVALEADTIEAAQRANTLTQLVSKVTSQYMETTTQLQERLHKLEVNLSDTRLERLSTSDAALKTAQDTLSAVETRFGELRADLLQRSAMEQPVEDGAFRAEFEDRLATLERRSLQALEQLKDTVALLSSRVAAKSEDEAALRSA